MSLHLTKVKFIITIDNARLLNIMYHIMSTAVSLTNFKFCILYTSLTTLVSSKEMDTLNDLY